MKKEQAAQYFAEVNHQNLMIDMAQGKGEYFQAFGALMGCEDLDAFAQTAQAKYSSIYANAETTPTQVVQNAKDHLSCSTAL